MSNLINTVLAASRKEYEKKCLMSYLLYGWNGGTF